MGRRGQVTIFIILAILLVLGTSIVLYQRNQGLELPAVPKDKDAKAVNDFVTDCVSSLATDAVKLAGMQGGFIYIPESVLRTPNSYIRLADAVQLPFWYYEGKNRVPELAVIQGHINRYVEENIDSCLDDFSEFGNRYAITTLNDPSVTSVISPQDVLVTLDFPMDIQAVNKELALDSFVVQLPVDLGLIHETTKRIMEYENEESWFENITMEFVSMHPDIPLNGIEFSCSRQSWRLRDVSDDLSQALQVNMPHIRVKGTDIVPFKQPDRVYEKIIKDFAFEDIVAGRFPDNAPSDLYEYAKMQLDAGIAPSNLKIVFDYNPSWGMDLNGFPNDNGLLTSRVMKGAKKYLSALCINVHHYTYDIIYPVRGSVVDQDAFNGDGFTFQFAFPVIVNDNLPDRVGFGYTEFRGFETAPGFCNDAGDTLANIRVQGEYPGFGFIDLPDVDITVQCANQICDLGTTKASGQRYALEAFLPDGCANPFVTASKEGYLTSTAQLAGDSLIMELTPLKTLNLEIEKLPYDASTDTFFPARPLRRGENVSIRIEHLTNLDFSQTLNYPTDKTVQIVDDDAEYSVQAILSLFDNLVGGYSNENLTITFDELQGASTLRIQVLESVPPVQTEEYTQQTTTLLIDASIQEQLEVVIE